MFNTHAHHLAKKNPHAEAYPSVELIEIFSTLKKRYAKLHSEIVQLSVSEHNDANVIELLFLALRCPEEDKHHLIRAIALLQTIELTSSSIHSVREEVLFYIKLKREEDFKKWLSTEGELWHFPIPSEKFVERTRLMPAVKDVKSIKLLNALDAYIMDYSNFDKDKQVTTAIDLFKEVLKSAGDENYDAVIVMTEKAKNPELTALVNKHLQVGYEYRTNIKKQLLLGKILNVLALYTQKKAFADPTLSRSYLELTIHLITVAEALYEAVKCEDKRIVRFYLLEEQKIF